MLERSLGEGGREEGKEEERVREKEKEGREGEGEKWRKDKREGEREGEDGERERMSYLLLYSSKHCTSRGGAGLNLGTTNSVEVHTLSQKHNYLIHHWDLPGVCKCWKQKSRATV